MFLPNEGGRQHGTSGRSELRPCVIGSVDARLIDRVQRQNVIRIATVTPEIIATLQPAAKKRPPKS